MIQIHKKGFTLVEMMIVIAIIGILAAALFPSLSGYLSRAKELDTQKIARRFVEIINLYIIDNGGFPASLPSQSSNPIESYCIEQNPDCPVTDPEYHAELSNYIKSTSDGRKLLADRDIYCNKFPGWYCSDALGWPMKESYKGMYDAWGYVFPGKGITDTTKSWRLYWYLDPNARYYTNAFSELTINGNNMPNEAIKRCSPGIPTHIYSDGVDSFTECIYIFQ